MLRLPYGWHIRILVAALSAATLLEGCGGFSSEASPPATPEGCVGPLACHTSTATAVAKAQAADTPVDPAIVATDNGFGLSLFNNLLQTNSGNAAIAPISVSLALQIVYNGAAGTTQQAMAQTLQLGSLTTQELNDDNAALQASLLNPDPNDRVTIANSLWTNASEYPIVPAFTDINQTYYAATTGDLAGAPANVNAWVASETNGLITTILPPGNYSMMAAVIVNTVYFHGSWTNAFDPGQTSAAPFTLGDGTETSVQMMHQTASFGYFQGPSFQAVRLPYGTGRLSMLVALPAAGTDLGSFVAGITADTIDSWESQLQTSVVALSLPRFTTSFSASLQDALTSLGMGVAFSKDAADFSGISPRAYISSVQHATVVEVNESGTTAAAATAVPIGISAVQAPEFTVTLDQPFFYAIRDDLTGELLFVGVMVNPNGG
jgi:serine protease inhibitor